MLKISTFSYTTRMNLMSNSSPTLVKKSGVTVTGMISCVNVFLKFSIQSSLQAEISEHISLDYADANSILWHS